MPHLKSLIRVLHLIWLLPAIAIGCKHYESETTETVVQRAPPPAVVAPQPPPMTLDRLVLDVQQATDGPSEAAALNRLHAWMADHGLTYRVSVVDSGGVAVPSASAAAFPVHVTVSILQREQVVRDFAFTPHDNRNLVILGVQ